MGRRHRVLQGARWQRLRRACFDRDGWRCVKCGKAGALECDHVLALHLGGAEWALGNVQTLCRGCHIGKTTAENTQPWAARDAWRALVRDRMGPA